MKKRCTSSPLRVRGDRSEVQLMFWDTGGEKKNRASQENEMEIQGIIINI